MLFTKLNLFTIKKVIFEPIVNILKIKTSFVAYRVPTHAIIIDCLIVMS